MGLCLERYLTEGLHRYARSLSRRKSMKLFKHQQDIVEEDLKKWGLFLGTGSGKTLTALSLATGKTLVVVPKTVRDDHIWEKNLAKLDKKLDMTVVSKEDFRRDWDKYSRYDTLILDELHNLTGVQPAIVYKNKQPRPKASQIFEACYNFIKQTDPERLYLLTATPVKNPMAVYATGLMLGKSWNFYDFRDIYYTPIKMNNREIWIPKKTTEAQERLGETIKKLGYTGKLSDYADVPEQTHRIINVALHKEQSDRIKTLSLEYPNPLVLVGKKHQVEQGVLKGDEFNKSETFPSGKLEIMENLQEEFGKILIFAKYTEQIEMIEKHFAPICPVIVITGKTENRGEFIALAEQLPVCVVVIQSSISAGYELPSFRCTVYASLSYSYVDLNQSQGRTLRINNLQKNLYVYIMSGEIDKAIYKALENKNDFQEATYETPRS